MKGRLAIGLASVLAMVAMASAAAPRPALLFCSPQGLSGGWLDLQYARELHAKGFEIDYTEDLAEVTPARIQMYNVLVIYATPDAFDVTNRGMKSSPEKAKAFAMMIDAYVAGGGGVLLMPTECNLLKQQVADLTDLWGAKLPLERIEEKDPARLGALTHASQHVPLAWTDQVLPSPVSDGVKQIWYPISPAYNAQMTGPLLLDPNWQVVVKASKTAVTRAIDLAKSTMPVLANPVYRGASIAEPPLFAIRSYQKGRIALVSQWRQFSIGSGTRFIFQRQVLCAGAAGKPSDFGRLLENTYRWLAAPSLQAGRPGGYITPPEKLVPPNAHPRVKQQYADQFWPYDRQALGSAAPPAHLKLFRGLIGAKTVLGGGQGTVAEYARAATEAALDFLVFMDEFERLDADKLRQLTHECRKHSHSRLQLFPGFAVRNNIGNRMFFFSPEPAWIPDYCLTGPGKKTLYIQEEDGQGGFTGYLTPFLDWVLNAYHVDKGQVGYFDFSASPHGMRMHDLRLYGMAAVRYYRHGRRVEDNLDAYLLTAHCTIPPAPVSVNEVVTPAELVAEVRAGHALVYAQASALDRVFAEALRWTHQYDAPNVSVSDGPRVLAWPACYRVWTLGAEEFVTGRSVMPSPLVVVSDKGLREIRLYNGRELYRRFLPGGAHEFRQTLVLEGSIQKNLVLVAEDVEGGRALTFARRCWKDGGLAVSFCSDHVNDGTMALTHGPFSYPWIRHPALPTDVAGETWDGGPVGALPLVAHQATAPVLECDQGTEDGSRFDQVPILEFSDDGALAVSSPRFELFDDKLKAVVNPWHTYGPIAGPSRLMEYTQQYREYVPPTVGTPQTGWAAPGVREGTNASLFRQEIRFKTDLTLKRLALGHFFLKPEAKLVVSAGGSLKVLEAGQPGQDAAVVLRRGDWLGLFAAKPANSNLFFNRGGPIRVEKHGTLLQFQAERQQPVVKRGEAFVMEIAGIGFPVNVPVGSAADLQEYVEYLKAPVGLAVLRGRRLEDPGLIEFAPDEGLAVELTLTRPPRKLGLTVPCRIRGLNPRWSAGLFQKKGYVKGDYGPGENRYRPLGVDLAGAAYVPLYPDYAELTHVVAGHPIVAGSEGRELFIQVTHVATQPHRWHVSVNNPTDRTIRTTLRGSMVLPGLDFPETPLTLAPGAYAVLH